MTRKQFRPGLLGCSKCHYPIYEGIEHDCTSPPPTPEVYRGWGGADVRRSTYSRADDGRLVRQRGLIRHRGAD